MAIERLTYRLGLKLPGSNEVLKTELFLTNDMAVKWGEEQRAKYGYNYEIDDLKTIPEYFNKYAKEKRKKDYPPQDEMLYALIKFAAGDSTLINDIILKVNEADSKNPLFNEKK
jgi:hypothetical protein